MSIQVPSGFAAPRPLNREALTTLANEPGVHIVWDTQEAPLYVGMSQTTRTRMLQHLSGDRVASILHAKVGRELDEQLGRPATGEDIRDWLGTCTYAVRYTQDPGSLKASLIQELHPRLNEKVPTSTNEQDTESMSLDQLLEITMLGLQLRAAGDEDFEDYKRLVTKQLPRALTAFVGADHAVKGSVGYGSLADVPWVAAFLPQQEASAKQGLYVVYLFAMDGSCVYLSLAQAVGSVRGGGPVLEKRSADIRGALGPQPGLLQQIDLKSDNTLPRRYEAATAYATKYEADGVPTEATLRADLLRFLGLLDQLHSEGLTMLTDAEPVHLVMKWNWELKPETVTLHRHVAETRGSVWWGKYAKPGTTSMSAARLGKMQKQLAEEVPTYCYLYRKGEVWRTRLLEITTDAETVDDDRMAGYYGKDACNLFLRITDFEELEPSYAVENLLLASNPSPAAISGALSNQTSPLSVYHRGPVPGVTTPPVPGDFGEVEPELLPEPEPSHPVASLDLEWLAAQTLMDKAWLEEVLDALARRPQVVLAGPPGTGKTWVAKALARYLTQDVPLASRVVQLHPSYGYEEFIEGLRPQHGPAGITFDRVDGAVLKMADRIDQSTGQQHVLVLDEMNRANLPRVFGELMYLLEYRDEPVDLLYTADFTLPASLLFLGTMNTADRNIRSIDIALRRRFEVFDFPPSSSILEKYYKAHTCQVPDLIEGFQKLNTRLTELLDRHHTVGHTFFMSDVLTPALLRSTWERQLLPLFEEYFFDSPEIVATLRLEEFWPSAAVPGDAD